MARQIQPTSLLLGVVLLFVLVGKYIYDKSKDKAAGM